MNIISYLREIFRAPLYLGRLVQTAKEVREGVANLHPSVQTLDEIRAGIANLNPSVQVLMEVREGVANLHPIVQLLAEIRAGIANLQKVPGSRQSDGASIQDDPMAEDDDYAGEIFRAPLYLGRLVQTAKEVREGVANLHPSVQTLDEIRAGIANLNPSVQVLMEVREGVANLHPIVQLLAEIRAGIANLQKVPGSRQSDGASIQDDPMAEDDDYAGKLLAELPKASPSPGENRLGDYAHMLDHIPAWAGDVPSGYLVDFMGTLTDARFQAGNPETTGGAYRQVAAPRLGGNDQGNGEGWFETVDWFAAARDAKDEFVMMSLGACYGAQAIGAYKALQATNPLPVKLVCVEGDPVCCEWIRKHFRDNGVDPANHWIVQAAVGGDNEPVLFPVGAPGLGLNNCISTNEKIGRRVLLQEARNGGLVDQTLSRLMRTNYTGMKRDFGGGHFGEIKMISAVTLSDLLSPFDRVDLLEVDIQQSEIIAIPPFMDVLGLKVRRVHIGTHGADVHEALYRLFASRGWEVIFNYPPNSTHDGPFGVFVTNDGVLTARNPRAF